MSAESATRKMSTRTIRTIKSTHISSIGLTAQESRRVCRHEGFSLIHLVTILALVGTVAGLIVLIADLMLA